MKKSIIASLVFFSVLLVLFVFFACQPPDSPSNQVNLTRIDLYLYRTSTVTGTFTIELRDGTGGTPAIWSATVSADSLLAGSNWNIFTVPDIALTKGLTYRIYATRSGTHSVTDGITWQSSDSVGDDYPQGSSSSPNAELDFMFKTYNDGVLDQQMTTLEYGYSLNGSAFSWWQEFVPAS